MHTIGAAPHASRARGPGLDAALLAFAAGVGALALPYGHRMWEALLALVGVALLWRRGRNRAWLLVLAGLLGQGYGIWRLSDALDGRLPGCADADWREVAFTVAGVPERWRDTHRDQGNARFLADVVVTGEGGDCAGLGRHRVRLSWYAAPEELGSGQEWLGIARLRPPWGYRNPAGFDYERWMVGQGVQGSGYVRTATLRRTGSPAGGVDALRLALSGWLGQQPLHEAGLVQALLLGDDGGIPDSTWQALRASGTIHLVVVSGLHVSMVAGIGYLLGHWLSRLCPPLLLSLGACRSACLPALLLSGGYTALAGAGVPALRAWLMSSLVLLAVASGRRIAPTRLLLLALVALLLVDPRVVHQQGFWLSFGAVTALIGYFAPRALGPGIGSRGSGGWRRVGRSLIALGRAQLVLVLVLSPLLGLTLGTAPLLAPLANAIAVPLVSCVVLPLLLLAAATALWLSAVAEPTLALADGVLVWLMALVRAVAAVPAQPVALSGAVQPLAMLLCVVLMGSSPGAGRLVLLATAWLVLLMPDWHAPEPGQVRISALDVGQGSAILVDTRGHRLIYDTGPAFPSGFNLAEAAVLPAFLTGGPARLDALVLSHADLDHTGGSERLVERLEPTRIWSPDADGEQARQQPCRAGVGWEWDGVRFRFLHPGAVLSQADNDRSCVLLVVAGAERALLAGDIPARVERRLPKRPVRLLFAPHHGSRTSSSMAFVRGYAPELVFVSAPRQSRYGHPHPEVLRRYRAAGAQVFVTGWHGALIWESVDPGRVTRWRVARPAYWRRAMDEGTSSR